MFEPLFKVTVDPSSDPKLHHFLKRVVGFDTVDDESKRERRMYKHVPRPSEWTSEQNPPYSYYMYYLYANIASLNRLRQALGYSTMILVHTNIPYCRHVHPQTALWRGRRSGSLGGRLSHLARHQPWCLVAQDSRDAIPVQYMYSHL